ncbi:MAG: hypothetical protein RJQ04_00930 [Longimicrobiales bacterium]
MSTRLAVAPELGSRGGRYVRLLGPETSGGPRVQAGDAGDALLRGLVDLMVVSARDAWPLREGLRLAAVLPRTEPRDVLVSGEAAPRTLATLPAGARVALAGRRRGALLALHRPDLVGVSAERGRAASDALREGSVDAAVMSLANARDAGLTDEASEVLDPKIWLPAPGQGAVVVLARADDPEAGAEAAARSDTAAAAALRAEWAVAGAVGGGQGRLGVLALPYARSLRVWAMIVDGDGRRMVRADVTGALEDPEAAGRSAAALLVDRGAAIVLS